MILWLQENTSLQIIAIYREIDVLGRLLDGS